MAQYVGRISWLNIMGIEEYILEPGMFTRIKAANARGKTSMVNGFVSLANGGGHEATLLRNGEKEGRVVVEFESGLSATKRITENGSDVSVRNADGRKATSKPVTMIQQLLNPNSVNPIAFFTAGKDERKKILLKAMPIKVDPDRIKAITGQVVTASGNAWDVLAAVEKTAREERRSTNVAITQKEAAVTQLEQALPATAGVTMDVESITEEIAKLDALRDEKLGKIATTLQKFRDKHKADSDKLKVEYDVAEANINSEMNISVNEVSEKIALLKKQIVELEGVIHGYNAVKSQNIIAIKDAKALEQRKLDDEFADYERRATEAKTARNAEWQQARGACDLQLKEARANIEAQGRIKQSMDNLAAWREELEELKTVKEQQDKAVSDLDIYRLELMSSLPIPGLEISDEDIYYLDPEKKEEGKKAWDGLNEAKRMELAFEIAKLQIGECPFMFVDGAERLDHKNFERFKENAIKSKIQCVTWEVDHDPNAEGFKVEITQ